MAKIEIVDLKKTYTGGKTAVENFTLTIDGGEFVVLLGPAESGKTAVLRSLCGLDDVTEGQILIDGEVANSLQPKDRDMAVVFKSVGLYPNLSVYDNLAFGLKMRKAPPSEIEKRIDFVATLMGLKDILAKKPKTLSAYERAKVSLARAVVRRSNLILMDDPLSGYDANLRAALRNDIIKLQQRLKVNVIFATKDAVDALTLADRIVYMEDGKIVQVGTPKELYSAPKTVSLALYIGNPKINLIEGIIDEAEGGNKFIFAQNEYAVDKPACRRAYMAVRAENVKVAGEGYPVAVKNCDKVEENKYLVTFNFVGDKKDYLLLSDTPLEGNLNVSFYNAVFFDAKTEEAL